jgi:hypothetical protein
MPQPNSMAPAQIPAQSKSWLARNWKLVLGLFVVLVLIGIAGMFGIVSFVMSTIKGSDVAKEAMARAQSNPAVAQRLGAPIEEGWLVSGSVNVSTGSGDADLALPISGPKGKGTVYVTAQKSAGEWTYSLMQAAIDGSGERIDLLAPPSAGQPAVEAAAAAPAPTPSPTAETPAAASDPPAAATPPDTSSTEGLGTADGEQGGTKVVIDDLKRGGGMLTLKFTIYNNSNDYLNTGMRFKADGYKENGGRSFSGITLIDGVSKKKYFVVADSDGNCECSEHVDDIKSKTQASLWAKFPAPPDNIQKITVVIPHFIPIDDVPIR